MYTFLPVLVRNVEDHRGFTGVEERVPRCENRAKECKTGLKVVHLLEEVRPVLRGIRVFREEDS